MHSKKLKQKQNPNTTPLTFTAIGTTWTIDLPSLTLATQQALVKEIMQTINLFDRNYSRFREDSLVYTMYKNPGTYPIPADAYPLLALYKKLTTLSNEAFTPLIGTLLEQAGYDKDYRLVKKELKSLPPLTSVLSFTKTHITLKNNMLLDFGACGKGYLVDIVAAILDKYTIPTYCIDASGDILVKSSKPLRVGLENPENVAQVIGVATINKQSICASAGNRRKWQEFHHILNPHTKSSPKHILATWVIAPTAILADALATYLFVADQKSVQNKFTFEYLILHADHTITKSQNFPAELYYN